MNLPTVRAKCLGAEVSDDLPAVWQGRGMNFQCGFFQDAETPESDFDNVTKFSLSISRDRMEEAAIAAAAVVGADWWMTLEGWNDGTQQHVAFLLSGAQMDFEILACQERLWWTVCATLFTGEVVTKGAGYLLVREDAASSGLAAEIINSVPLEFSIIDDVAYIVYLGAVYMLPVVFASPSGIPGGVVTASNETAFFHYLGGQWAAPVVPVVPPPDGAIEGEGVVIDEVLHITIIGISYTAAVVPTDDIPPAPLPITPGTVLVTGSDGAEYVRTVFPDGTVRFSPTYEVLP